MKRQVSLADVETDQRICKINSTVDRWQPEASNVAIVVVGEQLWRDGDKKARAATGREELITSNLRGPPSQMSGRVRRRSSAS